MSCIDDQKILNVQCFLFSYSDQILLTQICSPFFCFFVLTTHTASQCCCSFSALICMERIVVRFPEISALKISQKVSTIWFLGYFSGFWNAFLWGLLYSDGLGRIWGRKLNGGGGRFSFCSINFHQSLVLQAHYL